MFLNLRTISMTRGINMPNISSELLITKNLPIIVYHILYQMNLRFVV